MGKDDKRLEELKKQLKLRDRTVRVISENKKFRAVALKNSDSTLTAQKRHGMPALVAYLTARMMTSASMIAAFLKGEERIMTEAKGDGPISRIYAEAIQLGEIRAFADYDPEIVNMQLADISEAIGKGTFSVNRVLYGKEEPITGIIELQRGDIATDLAHYFVQSEQIPSAVVMDANLDENGLITDSGGILLQALPGATDEELDEVYESLQKAADFNKFLAEEMTPLGILKKVLPFEFEVVRSAQLDFFCRCSKDSFLDKLVTLGEEEIRDMQKQGNDELVCRFCNQHYHLDHEDFENILAAIKSSEN